jgi:quercetin dioxygenase-like cupin family protein
VRTAGAAGAAGEPAGLVRRRQALSFEREHGVTTLLAGPRLGSAELVVTRHVLDHAALDGPHFHDREKVLFVLDGAVEVVVDGAGATLHPGDAVLIPAGAVHDVASASADEPCQFLIATSGRMRFFEPDGAEVDLPSVAH